jgi:hypothetical protein
MHRHQCLDFCVELNEAPRVLLIKRDDDSSKKHRALVIPVFSLFQVVECRWGYGSSFYPLGVISKNFPLHPD